MPWMDRGGDSPEWVDDPNEAQRQQLGLPPQNPGGQASSPYVADPTGTGPNQQDPSSAGYGQPITTHYNQSLFGTDQAAQQIAQQYGGKVISGPSMEAGGGTPGSPFTMPNANYIQLPNGGMVNAGQISQWQQLGRQDLIDNEFKNAFGSPGNGAADTGAADWFQQYNTSGLAGVAGAPGATKTPAPGAPPAAGVTPRATNTGVRQIATPGRTLPRGTQVGSSDGDVATPPNLHGAPLGGGIGVGRPGATGGPSVTAPPASPVLPPPTGANEGGRRPGVTPPPTPATGAPVGAPAIGRTGGTGGGLGGNPPRVPPTPAPSSTDPSNRPPATPGGPISPNTGIQSRLAPGGYIDSAQLNPWSGGTGAIGGNQWQFRPGSNPGDILSNDRQFAYAQGQNLIQNYGEGLASENQRSRSLASVGDSLYTWMLNNPGYTPEQAKQIMNQEGLDGVKWTDGMANSNFLTQGEQGDIAGDPFAGRGVYNGQADNLRQDARNFGGQLTGIYDKGATDINSATGDMSQRLDDSIDGSKLGLSDDYLGQHHFGPQDEQAIIDDAARTVGQGTAAQTDQLQRQAAAAGTNAPLAMAAALDRQRQTGAVASADAMTKARIQAKQLGLDTSQQTEATRLGSEQDISGRRTDAAKTVGQADIGNQQYLTSGRAGAGLQTGQAYLNQENTIADKQTELTTQGEMQQQQRAQAVAQNRLQVNQANQASQFQRGSYTDQAQSQRGTQIAGAERSDLTAGRQDVRNEETTATNEQNSLMAGQLQAFGNITGSGQASEANAIRAAQLPTTLDKVVGGLAGATQAFAHGGIVDKPTVARLGEAGPEITIKLKPSHGGPMQYRRRNEVAYAA